MEYITDVEAEQRVLSAMLHSEDACIEGVTVIDEDDFYRFIHRNIFILSKDLYIRGVTPTFVEIIKEGHSLGLIQNTADIEELHYIAEQYIDDKNLRYWLDRVRDASKGRKAQELLNRFTEQIQQKKINIPDLIQMAGEEFMTLAMERDTETVESAQVIAELGSKLVTENVEKWRKLQDDYKFKGMVPLEGVPTGFSRLDNLTLGYKPGDLIILGAETGHGKTAFALNTAMAACIEGNKSLLYINTEMSEKQIAYRLGSILSQVPLQKIRNGSLTNDEMDWVKTNYKRLRDAGFYSSYMPNLTPSKLHNLVRKAKLQNNIEMLLLDYVGRMEKADPRLQEWQILEQIIKSQKIMAQNFGIACMVLVQLNPDGSIQGAKRMKNECDLMLKLIPVDQEQTEQIRTLHKRQYEKFNYRLFVDKSRDSQAGIDIPIVFDKDRQQIREAQVIPQ